MKQDRFDFWFDLSPKCTSKSQAESNTPAEKQQCLLKKGMKSYFHFVSQACVSCVSPEYYMSYQMIATWINVVLHHLSGKIGSRMWALQGQPHWKQHKHRFCF